MPLQETLAATVTELNTEGWISANFEWRGKRFKYKFQTTSRPMIPYKLGEEIKLVVNEGWNDRDPVVADIIRQTRD